MSQNKRQKMDLSAACSSASANTQQKNVIFDENETSFKEAVKWSGFVDRTLLIEQLLKEKDSALIFAPKRFGKSTNLDMIECFLQVEAGRDVSRAPQSLDELKELENFQAFCRYGLAPSCKILDKTDLVEEYFGRHPVIHLDFKDVRVSSMQDVEDDLRELVRLAYLKHSYLTNGDVCPDSPTKTELAKQTCGIWCNEVAYKEVDVACGLQELMEFLHAYHKREVYLLVDEFDAPAVNAVLAGKSGREVREISDHVTNLLGAAVKGDAAKHLLGSLITGVSYLGSVGISEPLNNMSVYKWLSDDGGRFVGYYGLGDDELTALLEHVFPDEEQKRRSVREEVEDLYSGYYFKDKALYCLWSVLHYVRARSTLDASRIAKKSFWGGCSIISEMGRVLTNSQAMKTMMTIMGEDYISFKPYGRLNAQDLADYINNGILCNNSYIMLTFLMEQGYLSHVPNQRDKARRLVNRIDVKVPNADVMVGFQEMFGHYCVKICGLSCLAMKECARTFKDMSIKISTDEFSKMLPDFYNQLKTVVSKFKGQAGANEGSMQAAMYTTMLLAGFRECRMGKSVPIGTEDEAKTGNIDLWMLDDDFAVIWRFASSRNGQGDRESAKESSRQACSEILLGSGYRRVPCVKILDRCPSKPKNYLLIGVSMDSECKPCMCCLLNCQDLDRCIFFPEE